MAQYVRFASSGARGLSFRTDALSVLLSQWRGSHLATARRWAGPGQGTPASAGCSFRQWEAFGIPESAGGAGPAAG